MLGHLLLLSFINVERTFITIDLDLLSSFVCVWLERPVMEHTVTKVLTRYQDDWGFLMFEGLLSCYTCKENDRIRFTSRL